MRGKLLISFFTCLLLTAFVYGQAPVASIVALDPISACPTFVVRFVGTNSGGAATTITWNFGGVSPDVVGGPPTGSLTPTAVYNKPGTYNVSMTLTNASGSSTSNIITVVVKEVPIVDFNTANTTGCFPFPVQFNNLSTSTAPITGYSWDFGDGSSSTLANPSHTYTLQGTFAVNLAVTNSLGCQGAASKSAYINIPSGVIADFSDSLSATCTPPTTAFFTNQSVISGTATYSWNFGDGQTSNQASPVHVYASAGSYTVTMTVSSNLGCTDTKVQPINIGSATVTSSFTAPDSICVGTDANFINTSGPTPNYSLWNFGDGATMLSANAIHVYNTVGNYTVTLLNQFSSCSDSTSKTIHVIAAPVPDFSALTTTNSCKFPFTVNFKDLSVGATRWLWDFGDGTTDPSQNPSHTFTQYGQYDVKLYIINGGGCVKGTTKTAFVKIAQPSIYANLPAYGCAPYNFTLLPTYIAVDGVASYSWDMGNGNTYTVANPPAQNYGPGVYIVKGTITTTGGCVATISDTIKVGTIKPIPDFSATPTSACVGQMISFKDLSANSPDQWMWYFGDGSTWSSQNPKYAYNFPDTFSVKLVAYNHGCSDSITKTNYIIVKPPLAKFAYSYNCAIRTQYTFHDSSIGATSWTWNYGDGQTATGQFPAAHNYATAGNYTVTLTVSNSTTSCSNSSSQTVKVGIRPDFAFTPNNTCKGGRTIVGATVYPSTTKEWWWDFGDGSPPVGPYSPSWDHTYYIPGNYPIKLRIVDSSGCEDSVIYHIQVNGPTADFTAPVTQSCGSFNASFTDASSLNGGVSPIVSWNWDFGDGSTASGTKTPTHTYAIQGSYPVKLKVTDASGCSDSVVKGNFIRLSVLKVNFTTTDSNYCPASLIKFTNTSDPAGGFSTVYTWDFGNGSTYTGFNPTLHTFPYVGKYTIKLVAKDAFGCADSMVKINYINIDTPNASFTIDNGFAPCPPLDVHFKFAGSYAKTLLWNFGTGQGVSNDSPATKHLYGLPGTYISSLTVTSPGGCLATTTKTIQVNGPVAKLTYSPLGGCDTLTVFFNAISSGITSYIWIYGDNTPMPDTTTNSFISHTYRYPGKFVPTVVVTDSTHCSVFYQGDTAIIVDSVDAKFIADKYRLCENGIINFTNKSDTTQGTVITDYFWDFADGSTSSGKIPNVPHMFLTPGLYNVKLVTTTQFGCVDSAFQQISVVANPVIDIAGDSAECVPATISFSGVILVPDTSLLTWKWDFGNGNSATQQVPPSQIYNKPGHYPIQLVATNSSGCKDTATADEYIYPLPTVFAGNDTTICLGQSAQLQVVGANSYTWLPPTNGSLSCITCPNPLASPVVTTTYYVEGTSSLGCIARDTILVTVNQPVSVTVSPNDSVCLGQSAQLVATGAALYTWTPATGLSNPKVANPMASPATTTTYQVIGSDNKYCFFDTGYVNIRVFNYPSVSAGPDATITVGSSYQMMGSASADVVSFAWAPFTALTCTDCYTPTANPNNTTNYTLRVVNDGGCVSADTMRLTVICNNTNFFIPNTFSPNGDGMNDVFYVRGKGLNLIASITIFNRWGQIVFQKKDFTANDPSAGWDGNFNGQKAAADVYVYTVEIICDNSALIPYHGNLTLIR